jgi:hypothetical protein
VDLEMEMGMEKTSNVYNRIKRTYAMDGDGKERIWPDLVLLPGWITLGNSRSTCPFVLHCNYRIIRSVPNSPLPFHCIRHYCIRY